MAMGLASMNPMVGSNGTGLNRGNIMINSLCPEKDAQWGNYSVSKTLDDNDNRLTVDDNGKLCIKDKKDPLNVLSTTDTKKKVKLFEKWFNTKDL